VWRHWHPKHLYWNAAFTAFTLSRFLCVFHPLGLAKRWKWTKENEETSNGSKAKDKARRRIHCTAITVCLSFFESFFSMILFLCGCLVIVYAWRIWWKWYEFIFSFYSIISIISVCFSHWQQFVHWGIFSRHRRSKRSHVWVYTTRRRRVTTLFFFDF